MKKIVFLFALLFLFINCDAQRRGGYNLYENDRSGLVLTLSGISFTTAAILEGNKNYGSWQSVPGRPGRPIYVVPNFWRQTPRQIVFFTGVTLTFTGLITSMVNHKSRR